VELYTRTKANVARRIAPRCAWHALGISTGKVYGNIHEVFFTIQVDRIGPPMPKTCIVSFAWTIRGARAWRVGEVRDLGEVEVGSFGVDWLRNRR